MTRNITADDVQAIVDALQHYTGASDVDLLAQTMLGVPIPDVNVAIFDSTNSVQLFRGVTQANGHLLPFALNDGTYKVRAIKAGVSFVTPQDLIVGGATESTVNGTVLSPSLPDSPITCLVWDVIVDAVGQPIEGAAVKAYPATPNEASGYMMGSTAATTSTDASGYFQIPLVIGSEIVFEIAAAGYDSIHVTIPDEAEVQLSQGNLR